MLYTYCEERNVAHRRAGKLIVATREQQVNQLLEIRSQASANGVDDLVLLNPADVARLEPDLQCSAALLSPSTGIVDSHALMLASVCGDMENAGGVLALNSAVAHMRIAQAAIEMVAKDGTQLQADTVVMPLVTVRSHWRPVWKVSRPDCVPTQYFAKGSYFNLWVAAPSRI